jgi:hypothetical protein
MLTEAVNAQREMESKCLALKEENKTLRKRADDMVVYIRTQDHIYSLKLKERELLLRELTEQVNQLRSQVGKDKKLLAEIKKGYSLPVMELSKTTQRSVSMNPHQVRIYICSIIYRLYNINLTNKMISYLHLPNARGIQAAPVFKIDMSIEEDAAAARPGTASLSRQLMTLPTPSHRPSSSPASKTGTEFLGSAGPINLSQSLKVFCGSSSPAKPALYESQGRGGYEHYDAMIEKELKDSKKRTGVKDMKLDTNNVEDRQTKV